MKKFTQKTTEFVFFKEIILVHLFLLLILSHSQAQVKGAWGDSSLIRYQKVGETYAGFKAGFGGAPNGVSFFTHLSPNKGLEVYFGYSNKFMNNDPALIQRGNTFFGVSFQPRLNFRTENLSGAYYINMGGRTRLHNYRLGQKEEIKAVGVQEVSLITPELVFGFGACIEVYRKVQLFAELNQAYHAQPFSKENKNMYMLGELETNFGVRLFIF